MIDSDEKIKQDWERLDNADIEEICELLKKHELRIQDYLVDYVASLCNVDKKEMMTTTSKVDVKHARWFFWYVYRYMTSEPYGRIVEITKRYGRKFTEQCVVYSVAKMSEMISDNELWERRWILIKRIIKLRENHKQNISVVVHHPKNVEVKLKEE